MLNNYWTGLQTKKTLSSSLSQEVQASLHHPVHNWVKGYEHSSGGRGNSRITPIKHEGKLNRITGPVCNVDFKLSHVHPL